MNDGDLPEAAGLVLSEKRDQAGTCGATGSGKPLHGFVAPVWNRYLRNAECLHTRNEAVSDRSASFLQGISDRMN